MAAETPPPSSPPPPPPPPPPLPNSNTHHHHQQHQQYWCHHCERRVSTETLPDQPDVICTECKFGFVESIPHITAPTALSPPPPSLPPDLIGIDEPTLGTQFLHVLRLLAQVARDDHPASPPPPPPPPPRTTSSPSDDFLRIEIDSWAHRTYNNNDNGNDEEEEDEEEEEEEEHVRSVEIEGESDDGGVEERDNEDERRRQRRDVLRLRLRDFATRARSGGRNRILDWAEILMELEDNSIEFRFEMPAVDRYVGNPGDYVDAAEYDALLQNLADAEGRRGAPPAAKSAIEALKVVEIKADSRVGYEEASYVCAICKDGVSVGDVVKEMPCGHGYHGDCIVPWLAARNSCPVCRFELPTEDPDYEEDKKKHSSAGSGSSNGGGNAGSSTVGSSSAASV